MVRTPRVLRAMNGSPRRHTPERTHRPTPLELHERLAAQAKRDRRSVNGEIVHLLETALADPSTDGESP